jgi:hypothetical protein
MSLDSDKIRQEIRKFLQSNGRSRSKKLADEVIKKVGSEKTVYREIKLMYESGEIKKTEKNRAEIEYELVEYAKIMENNFKTLSKQLEEVSTDFLKFKEWVVSKKPMPHYLPKLFTFVQTIKRLNNIETRLRIISGFPAFQNSKSIPILQKQIDNIWSKILSLINHLEDDKLISELFMNFPYVKIVEATVN